MKKHLFFTLVCVAAIAFAFTHSGNNPLLHKNTGGPPAGHSGDPAGGNQNCTACHSGSQAQMETGWISSNIPTSGYVPGTTYSIFANATGPSITKFGFQISPQNSSGVFLGTLVNTNSQTQLSSNQKYIHQTSSGTAGTGSKTWTFNWIAPAANSGSVTFYGAFNLTNSGNNTSGDVIKLSTFTINENTTVDIQSNNASFDLKLFPNPTNDYLYIHADNFSQEINYKIIDVAGAILFDGKLSSSKSTIDMTGFPAGIYFLQILQPEEKLIKFLKH